MPRKNLYYLFTLLIATMATTTSLNAQGSACMAGNCGSYAPMQTMPSTAGCSANFSDCGQPGALFESPNDAYDSGCSNSSCGATCGPTCGQGCGGGRRRGEMTLGSRLGQLKSLLPFGNKPGCGKYISVFGGWSDLHDYFGNGGTLNGSFNDGFLLGVARGRTIRENTRFEIENAWRNNSGETWSNGAATQPLDGRINNFATMLNLVRDFGEGCRITPYAGAGIGYSYQDGEFEVGGNAYEVDDWAFAYQGMVGLTLKQTKRVNLYAEYRYFANTKTQLERPGIPVGDFEFISSNVVFGLRFQR